MGANFGFFAGGLVSGVAQGMSMYEQANAFHKQQKIDEDNKNAPVPGSVVADPNYIPPPDSLQPNGANTASAALPGISNYMAPYATPGATLPADVVNQPSYVAPPGQAPMATPTDPQAQLAQAAAKFQTPGAPAAQGYQPPNTQVAIPTAAGPTGQPMIQNAPAPAAPSSGAAFTPVAGGAANLSSALPSSTGAAAASSGPSPAYGARVVQAESGGDPNAQNPNSSATGTGQFIDSTWLPLIKQLHPELTSGKSESEILALRNNPTLSMEATQAYAVQNTPLLQKNNVPINDATLYGAHWLGPEGATKLYNAAAGTPMQEVIGAAAAKANNLTDVPAEQVKNSIIKKMGVGPSAGLPTSDPSQVANGAPVPPVVQAAQPTAHPEWPTGRDPASYLGTAPNVAEVENTPALQAVAQQARAQEIQAQAQHAQEQGRPAPPGMRYVTNDEYDKAREDRYLNSGVPSLMEVGTRMRANRVLAARQEQLVAEGKIDLAHKVIGQMLDHALETMAINPQAGLDEATSVLNHGVPNKSRMVIDPADGPVASDGKYVITHLMNGKIVGKDSPQTLTDFAARLKGMSNPEGLANFLAKSSEVAKNQAEAQHWATQNKILDEELRQGKPAADVAATRAKIDTEISNQKMLSAYRAAQEEGMKAAQAKAARIAQYAQTYADPNSSAADKARAYNLRAMEEGAPPVPEPHTDNNGNVTITNLGSVDPYLSKSDLLGGGFYPTNTDFKLVAADPDWKKQRIVSVKDPLKGVGWTAPELPPGPNGQRPFSKSFRDLQLALHPELQPKTSAVPAQARPSTAPNQGAPAPAPTGIPYTAGSFSNPVAPQGPTVPGNPYLPADWRTRGSPTIPKQAITAAKRAVLGTQSYRNPGGVPADSALPRG